MHCILNNKQVLALGMINASGENIALFGGGQESSSCQALKAHALIIQQTS